MKAEIILAVAWISFCICERQQRSTVLTDEYKRVLEHFDFSNFDKQEALNYIDRQRYENQIRGKRSHSKCKRDDGKIGKFAEIISIDNAHSNKLKMCEPGNLNFQSSEKTKRVCPLSPFAVKLGGGGGEGGGETWNQKQRGIRNKRGHREKKKQRSKNTENDDLEDEDYDQVEEEEEDEEKPKKNRKRRRKKKKRKRQYWNAWSDWSPCSVTCGRGRKIRWRKCIVKNCSTGELEMGEKTCQLPACNLLTKLLGL